MCFPATGSNQIPGSSVSLGLEGMQRKHSFMHTCAILDVYVIILKTQTMTSEQLPRLPARLCLHRCKSSVMRVLALLLTSYVQWERKESPSQCRYVLLYYATDKATFVTCQSIPARFGQIASSVSSTFHFW